MLENIWNAITRLPTDRLGYSFLWSHPLTFSTCPPCCGCHGNGRCLATAHWTFCSYGPLETERMNQFWWNLLCNSKLGPQWQSRGQILKFLKSKMSDGRHVGNYLQCHISPTNGPTGMQLFVVASHHVLDMSAMLRLPWQRRAVPCNGALDIQQLRTSEGRTREPILMKFGIRQQIRTTMTVAWSNIRIFKIQNGGRSLLENSRNAITRLPMDRLGRNLGGRIPSCSQYWKCYNSS